tara:strand:- start:754 stop:1035 length:282 start_codon:yes stop_codon:yes gene_type:complete
MGISNLTNPGKDPVEGDELVKDENGLIIKWTQGSIPTAEETARSWRDQELINTDWIISITDHPQHDAYKTYRTKLRDWPSTSDFPDTKPELGS